mmetsp:Transcript_22258/g.64702  ORF Transcript_22258/g.64702 Transcript_22258/m.64702 type:complete len:232 (-) Transcript_22258:276-971(-)
MPRGQSCGRLATRALRDRVLDGHLLVLRATLGRRARPSRGGEGSNAGCCHFAVHIAGCLECWKRCSIELAAVVDRGLDESRRPLPHTFSRSHVEIVGNTSFWVDVVDPGWGVPLGSLVCIAIVVVLVGERILELLPYRAGLLVRRPFSVSRQRMPMIDTLGVWVEHFHPVQGILHRPPTFPCGAGNEVPAVRRRVKAAAVLKHLGVRDSTIRTLVPSLGTIAHVPLSSRLH